MKQHWLYLPATRRKLWIAGIAVLVLTVIAELFIHPHAYFLIAEFFGFFAVYGFLSCVILVVIANLLGWLLKRKDDYYDD
jgi:hypothetical protein